MRASGEVKEPLYEWLKLSSVCFGLRRGFNRAQGWFSSSARLMPRVVASLDAKPLLPPIVPLMMPSIDNRGFTVDLGLSGAFSLASTLHYLVIFAPGTAQHHLKNSDHSEGAKRLTTIMAPIPIGDIALHYLPGLSGIRHKLLCSFFHCFGS